MRQIIKFEKEGCVPCKNLDRWLKENQVAYVSKNIMNNLDLARTYNVKSVPTLLVLDGEVEVSRAIGFDPETLKGVLNG